MGEGSPSSRQLFVDWEQAAYHAAMHFRAAYNQYSGDAWFEHFLTDLQQKSPEFRTFEFVLSLAPRLLIGAAPWIAPE